MPGWVRKQHKDDLEFNKVYVEWDKDHWRYSGQADGWTFEEHFDLVEDKMTDESPEEQFKQFREFQEWQKAQGITTSDDGPTDKELAQIEAEALDEKQERAQEAIKNSQAYFVLAVHEESNGTNVALVPYMYSNFGEGASSFLLKAQLSGVVNALFVDYMADAMQSADES